MSFNMPATPAAERAIARQLLDSAALSQFTGILLAEIAGAASEQQLRGFFLAVGRKLAALRPADDIDDIEALVERMNGLWDSLGWGQVALEVDDEGIDLFHLGMPTTLEGDNAGIWPAIAPVILEGAYDAWFRHMGSGERLSTRLLRQVEGRIELRHGI